MRHDFFFFFFLNFLQVSRPNPQLAQIHGPTKLGHHSQQTHQNLFIDDIERSIREFASY